MSILNTLKFITSHPLTHDKKLASLIRFTKWQLNCRLNPHPVVYPFIGESKLVIKRGMSGATGNIYTGLHEFTDMSFLLHFLREEDLFIDAGANVGTYTVLASAVKKAKTISIEPISSSYKCLCENIAVNFLEAKVIALNIGLGSKKAKLKFKSTSYSDPASHVAADTENSGGTFEVEVDTLDNLLERKNPTLLKLDVEGFETEVLRGADKTLSNPSLTAIIIEYGLGIRYGYDETEIHNKLTQNGFVSYKYEPFTRVLTAREKFGGNDTIYIRNIDLVKDRLLKSEKIEVLGKSF